MARRHTRSAGPPPEFDLEVLTNPNGQVHRSVQNLLPPMFRAPSTATHPTRRPQPLLTADELPTPRELQTARHPHSSTWQRPASDSVRRNLVATEDDTHLTTDERERFRTEAFLHSSAIQDRLQQLPPEDATDQELLAALEPTPQLDLELEASRLQLPHLRLRQFRQDQGRAPSMHHTVRPRPIPRHPHPVQQQYFGFQPPHYHHQVRPRPLIRFCTFCGQTDHPSISCPYNYPQARRIVAPGVPTPTYRPTGGTSDQNPPAGRRPTTTARKAIPYPEYKTGKCPETHCRKFDIFVKLGLFRRLGTFLTPRSCHIQVCLYS